MKRFLSILLSAAIASATLPSMALARGTGAFNDVGGSEYYAQPAEALAQLAILEGYDDGSFGAERNITRAEMTAVICRMLGKENEAKKVESRNAFDDVSPAHWASGYINFATDEDIIEGDGDGKFRPEDNVKYEEALKMVVCAVGLGDDVEYSADDWAAEYISIAENNKITKNLIGSKGNASSRGDVAVMVYNGLIKDLFAPVASMMSGTYTGTQEIELTTATANADIYYTTDGTAPTASSKKYTSAVSISKTSTLKAVAVLNDALLSDVMSVDYTIKTSSGRSRSSSSSTTSYTVTFDTRGGTTVDTQTVRAGGTATEPEDPEKDGFTFIGWVDSNGNDYNFSTAVNENLSLSADWITTIRSSDEEFKSLTQTIVSGTESFPINDDIIVGVDIAYKLDDIGGVGAYKITSDPILMTAGLVGAPVNIKSCGGNVISSEITFHYNEDNLEGMDPEDFAIVWYDEENNVMALIDNSTVDTTSKTVSADTTHFSKYGVVLRSIWDAAWNTQLPAVRTNNTPYYDVILAMDCSGSMGDDAKMSKSIEAAQGLIDILADDDCVSIYAFESDTHCVLERTMLVSKSETGETIDNRDNIKSEIASITANGGTNIERALKQAATDINTDSQYQSLVILLSDGQSSVSDEILKSLKNNQQKVISVGIGSDTDSDLMQHIANETEGSYIFCENATDLADAFEQLQNIYIGSTVDSDNDGLPDLVETTGMRDQYGEIWRTDPKNADSDADGYTDGEEMGNYFALTSHPYFKRVSRPDLYTVKSDEAYMFFPEKMQHSFVDGENKLKLIVGITDLGYRMVPDEITPMDSDGIPKEYVYAPIENLNAQLTDISPGFKLEGIDIDKDTDNTNGLGTDYSITAYLSYSKTSTLNSATWHITADNCSEWSGKLANGIKADYIEKKQDITPTAVASACEAETKMAELELDWIRALYDDGSNKAAKSEDISEAREKIKSQLSIVGDKSSIDTVPNEVYDAFATAILETIDDSNIDKYETNMKKLTAQIYDQVKGGINTTTKDVNIGGTIYEVTCFVAATSFLGESAGVGYQQVRWKRKNGPYQYVYMNWTNAGTEEANKALANYCALLAQLNTDLWKDFLAYYVSDGFGLLGVKSVTATDVKNVLNKTEKVINGICGSASDANVLIEDIGDAVKSKLKSTLYNKVESYVKNQFPNGNTLVNTASKCKQLRKKYDKLQKQLSKDQNSTKAVDALDDFNSLYEEINSMINAIK